jgi:hypothetical protein
MGAWSAAAFGNDSALDWLGDLLDRPGGADWATQYRAVLDEFAEFEQKRATGTHREVRTAEEAEFLIAMFDPPLDAETAALVRDGIGQEYEDDGHDQTFRLVAAGAVLLAWATGELSGLPEDIRVPALESAGAGMVYRKELVEALRHVQRNKPLLRECGSKWKKGVVELSDRLEGLQV